MRVTRLELFGFKSFLEKIIVPVESGFTAIVGPNGCGKSNVVDALRWVLGETRASSLRGSSLEDVIFNGTDKLRPLGLAEVSLTLRPSEAGFFADLCPRAGGTLAEIPPATPAQNAQVEAPSPQISGNGDEMSAAKSASGSGAEMGRPRLTVISGALDEKYARAPVSGEVCEVNEPAQETSESGDSSPEITPVGAAPDTAQEEEPVDALLQRFAWLKGVEEVQVTRRLYRSGESEFFINRVACRLRDIRDLFRAVGLGARAYTIVAQGEVGRIVTSKPEDRRMLIEEAAGVVGFRDKIQTASRRLEETALNVSRLQDVIVEVTRQVNSLKVHAARARNRQTLKARLAELDRALYLDQKASLDDGLTLQRAAHERAVADRDSASAAYEKAMAREHEIRSELLALDTEADSVRSRLEAAHEEVSRRNQERSGIEIRQRESAAKLQVLRDEYASIEGRLQILRARLSETESDIERQIAKDRELSAHIGGEERDTDAAMHECSQRLEKTREEIKVRQRALREEREALVALDARIAALREQLSSDRRESGEATTPLFPARPEGASGGADGRGPERLLEFLDVPSRYVEAVDAVLRERSGYKAVDSLPVCGGGGSERSALQGVPDGSGVFLCSEAAARNGFESAQSGIDVPLPRLFDLVSVREAAQAFAGSLLRDAFFAETFEEARAVAEGHRTAMGSALIVTAHGEIVTALSVSGKPGKRGMIEVREELRRIESEREPCLERVRREEDLCRELDLRLVQAEEGLAQSLKAAHEREAHVRALSADRGAVRGRLDALGNLVQQIRTDIARSEERRTALAGEVDALQRSALVLAEEMQSLAHVDDSELAEQVAAARSRLAMLEQKRKELRMALSASADEGQALRVSRDGAEKRLAEFSLQIERVQLELASVRERFISEYGQERGDEVDQTQASLLSDEARTESRDEAQKIRARLLREGEVDSTSIERLAEEQARLENLESQRSDLEAAAETLRQTIARLTRTSEERFLSVFDKVAAHFESLIPRLFGGGRGSLELSDRTKPLESGVEITVRPPGKKLKSIDLMSGGEKALSAIALIVAMFLVRPSPLCVLDEVDAPLDEANLVRFLSLLKEMSTKTQFVVITHNKHSMAVADRLIGVTMQQPGSSRVVAVSLQEAYSQVA